MRTTTIGQVAWVSVALMLAAAWGAFAFGARAGARAADQATFTATAATEGGTRRQPLTAALAVPPAHAVRIRRDPFRFGESAPAASKSVASVLADAALQALMAVPATPAGPAITLVGLAESAEGQRLVRTAVVSVDGDILLVREGDRVGDRFRVTRITAESVHLEGPDGGPARVLRWR